MTKYFSRTLNALFCSRFKMSVGELFSCENAFNHMHGFGDEGRRELKNKTDLLVFNKAEQENLKGITTASSLKMLFEGALPSLRDIPLDWLHLDRQTHKALLSARIASIEDLYHADGIFIKRIQGYHRASLGDLNHKIVSLLNTLNEQDSVDWFTYWKSQDITVLPDVEVSNAKEKRSY